MKERAYAKINLCLDVVKGRKDGYHDLRMIMVPIDFYDVLEMTRAEETSLRLNRSYLPVDEKNTVIKAISVLRDMYHFDSEYACVLEKHIPTQAGLAGGSADAAAAIRMLNRMEHLHMTRNDMVKAARSVGSDVPFCVLNQPALVEGTGEVIEPFVCHPDFHVLLVKPKRGVSTALAFQKFDELETPVHPDVDGMRQALIEGDYAGVVRRLANSLEDVSMDLVPEIKKVKQELTDFGFDGVLMSGSGSTVFGITQSRRLLNDACDTMRQRGYFTRMTRILARSAV
ncbi:4-(cytidine 5'-diphospho)-2-C-methyl-D-erythritol kinase [Galactobacillus timonensis]|jgi:4-diphosphocytidyl-2-C-methyl-D-erythritol kinase|uniref:4-(cytidine 5'-diphospho)-2-C-methyl-D-erythritol kinase n=1 Tax=Galactobacillus timonensis TaxID=2041840 RepID=UPI000C868069|nr:4-(cytidine 5'-diphospho)-2-C-methyl-D-erythritol kinase [Galactobacillus timonensis]